MNFAGHFPILSHKKRQAMQGAGGVLFFYLRLQRKSISVVSLFVSFGDSFFQGNKHALKAGFCRLSLFSN